VRTGSKKHAEQFWDEGDFSEMVVHGPAILHDRVGQMEG
jgi:hypothetical protein